MANRNSCKETLLNNEAVVGTCYAMCPEREVNMRTKEGMVHTLEVVGHTKKLVKAYSRSAADSNMAVPKMLRPFPILRATIKYLLFEVLERTDVPTNVVYDFVDDRLRAVRQDMTIQRLGPGECVILLEPMVRFYVYFGYKLCEHPLSQFVPTLNKKKLLECLKLFLNYTDILDTWKKRKEVDKLTAFFSKMELNNIEQNALNCDRVLMEGLYIMCNFEDLNPLYRYYKLSKSLQRKPTILLAYKIAVANLHGNFIKATKLSNKLCPLCKYTFYLYLPTLQRNALRVASHAFHSKQLSVPTTAVTDWLMFNSNAETVETCAYYGLSADLNAVRFSKADFKQDLAVISPKIFLRESDSCTKQEIITYDTTLYCC